MGVLRKVRTYNSTVATIAAVAPLAVLPGIEVQDATSVSLIDLSKVTGLNRNRARLYPFGTGSDANTMAIRVFIWNPAVWSAGVPGINLPYMVLSGTCVLDASLPGVANTPIPAAMFFCKSFTVSVGANLGPDLIFTNSPGVAGALAFVDFPLYTGKYLDVRFGLNTSSTDCNGLIEFY